MASSKKRAKTRKKIQAERNRLEGIRRDQVLQALAGKYPQPKYKGWRGNRPRLIIIDETQDLHRL